MTVYENMAFGLKLRKYPREEIKKRVYEAGEILDLIGYLDRKPKALSGGQRQRVALGRAIVRKPKVFLFDEPLSNLDAKLRVQMRIEINKLHQRLATTMIYVTHDQVEAMTMGNRIAVMKNGIIQQVDQPLILYQQPTNRFVAGFIGSPAMNFFEGQIQQNQQLEFKSNFTQFAIPPAIAARYSIRSGQKVLLGVRPEHFSLGPAPDGPSVPLQARVEVVEPMGNEIFVYFSKNGYMFTVRSPAGAGPAVNQDHSVYLSLDHLHFFDFENSDSLLKDLN
jgi:multiple sugar transport system ATP-binding protein